MDNASNNDSFVKAFAALMKEHENPWFDNPRDGRIMCFPHIVNLASGAVIQNSTSLEFSEDLDDDSVPTDFVQRSRLLVKRIRASCYRTDLFSLYIDSGNKSGRFRDVDGKVIRLPDLKLILDVKTRWDSLKKFIERLIDMRPVRLFSIALMLLFSCVFLGG